MNLADDGNFCTNTLKQLRVQEEIVLISSPDKNSGLSTMAYFRLLRKPIVSFQARTRGALSSVWLQLLMAGTAN